MIGRGRMYMSATLSNECRIHDITVLVEDANPKEILKNEIVEKLNSIAIVSQ
jgi:hypothetical protein